MVNLTNQIIKIQNNINFINKLEELRKINESRPVVFLCVGSSKIWYDSFGPMMGTLLQYLGVENYVYGNLKSNVLGNNIENYISLIHSFHIDPYIVVLDCAISESEDFYLKIYEGETQCAYFSNRSTSVGDLSLNCVVPKNKIDNCEGFNNIVKLCKKLAFFIKFVFIENEVKLFY